MPQCLPHFDACHESFAPRSEAATAHREYRRVEYVPTVTEITAACARIRSGWTRHEKRRRFVGQLVPDELDQDWQPPVIDTSFFRLGANGLGEGA
jgi:hypothetical protein